VRGAQRREPREKKGSEAAGGRERDRQLRCAAVAGPPEHGCGDHEARGQESERCDPGVAAIGHDQTPMRAKLVAPIATA
jgi:hypothetical protein